MQMILGRLLLLLAMAAPVAVAQETATGNTEEAAQAAEIDVLEPGSSSQGVSAERTSAGGQRITGSWTRSIWNGRR
jgi:hypothetical protein